jgi:anti-sigma regulatory factor (Ser/Thr protein kinase)
MVRSQLEAWGLLDELAALELAVSELVTNAIVHGRGQVDVIIAELDGCVRLEVRDEGIVEASRPTVRSDDGGGGWGLRLVEGLSDTWGTRCDGGRTHVWMERRTQGGTHELDGGGTN